MSAIEELDQPTLIYQDVWDEVGKVPVAGGSIQWAKLGSGRPIVVMPKIGGWIADWRHIAELLAADYQVIAIDPPGHGGSAMLGEPPFMISLEQSAAAVMTTLDMLGVQKFSAAGNSMGGLILLAATAGWPERVEKLCMISSALVDPQPIEDVRKANDRREEAGDKPPSFEEVNSVFGLTRQTYDEFVLSKEAAGAWKNPCICGVGMSGPMKYITRSSVPTMLISGGANDMAAQFEEKALRLRPDIRRETIEDCGAFAHQDKPMETHALLRDFFD